MNQKREISAATKKVSILMLIAAGMIIPSCNKEACPANEGINNIEEGDNFFTDSSYGSRYVPSPLTEEQKVIRLGKLIRSYSDDRCFRRDISF